MQAPCLFLSHSGADADGARELKRRLTEAPLAREAGLTVWFDKDDLRAGLDWQEQLEIVITRQATAFAVLVGSKGVINWVEREVRLGLARATGEEAIPFISIVAAGAKPEILNALPAFAQQHQGIVDPLNDATAFARLLDAILGRSDPKPARLTDEPFVGLRAMTEREADRFFGRAAEVAELVEDLRRNRLVAVVADSGAGKSSLAMAGLAPAFRGGALAPASRRGVEDAIWHVVVMRPGGDPVEGLRRGVTEAAERMGFSPDARAGLRRRIVLDDVSEAAYALRCDLPAATTETLLIVDQFDELLTETPEAQRQPFIDALLKLAGTRGPGGFYVVLTVRVDYFNLCRPYGALYSELQTSQRVLRLKRISDAGLDEAVRAPLKMAGFADEPDQRALASEMKRDLGDRAGDLALAQMALWTVWRNRHAHGGSLIKAYVEVGGVSGALAQEAEQVRLTKLSEAERTLLPALFVRLVRLGETGGVLRRLASKEEFDAGRAALAEKLAADDHGRLLLVSEGAQGKGAKIEVCHEALITQWPWLQNTLNAAAADLRVLDRLMDRAATWCDAPADARGRHLATGAERELFAELGERRDAWISSVERAYILDSTAAFAREVTTKRASVRRLRMMVSVLGLAVVALVGVVWYAFDQKNIARSETARAEEETQNAQSEKMRAEANSRLAEQQKKAADAERARAEEEARVADGQKALAQEQTRIADTERVRAEEQAKIAKEQKALADEQSKIAGAQRARADADFSAAKAAVNRLIFDIVQDLEYASGMPVVTLRRVLDSVETTVDALALSEPDDRELQHLRLSMLTNFVDLYSRAEDDASARAAADAGLQIARHLAVDQTDPSAQSDLSISLARIGSVELNAGDLAGAQAAFEEALVIERKLAGDKDNAAAQRNLGSGLSNIGDVKLKAGNLAEAQVAFEEALVIDRELAKDKGDAIAQGYLATDLQRLGNVKLKEHDLNGAHAAYDEELTISREIAKDKGNARAQISLALALSNVGDVDIQAGDLVGAGAAYDEELVVARDLAKDKSDARMQSALAETLGKVADVKLKAGDSKGAEAAFDEALAICRERARVKDDVEAQRDLADALEKFGGIKLQAGDRAGAEASYDEALAIRRDRAENKNDAQAQRNLAEILGKIGDVKLQAGDLVGAQAAYEEMLSVDRTRTDTKTDAQAQRDVGFDLNRLVEVELQGGDAKAALMTQKESLKTFHEILTRTPGNAEAQEDFTSALGSTAYISLFDNEYSQALALSDEAIALSPTKIWLYGNRAHALMLLGQTGNAREIYYKYRGKFAQGTTIWEKSVLDDFAALRKAGIINPLMDEIEKDFQAPSATETN